MSPDRLPHLKNDFYWHEEKIHTPFSPLQKFRDFDIFHLEKEAVRANSAKNVPTAHTPATSVNTSDEADLKEAQAKIKELQDQIKNLQKANESERQNILDRANEEAANIKTAASVEAEKIKADAEEEAKKIREKAQSAVADAEVKAQTVFKNKIAQKIVKQRNMTRDTNIDTIKSEVKKYYAKPADLAKNSNFIEKSANDLQSIFSTAMNDAIEKLKAEKTQMYEQMDQLRKDMYPTKEKLCIKWYLDYYGTWNKTGDTVIAALLANIEAYKESNVELDPDDKIANNLIKLSGMLEKFMVEFENAIAALGFEIIRPQAGERYNSLEHRCADQSDDEDTDDFNGRRITSCKKPGIKRIGLSGATEVLEFAEVVVEE